MHLHHAITLSLVVSSIVGCADGLLPGNTGVMCDCATGGTSVTVADGLTATAITLSGDACDASDLACSMQTDSNGVATCVSGSYFILSTRVGTCHVEIELDGHAPFTRDLHFEHVDGCCHGIYPVDGDWLVSVEA